MIPTATPAQALTGRTLGDIAASLPGSTAVFRTHKLDFCCGGNVTLREAAARKGLSADAIAEQLRGLHPAVAATPPQSASALIDHIIERYHQVHRRELPELIRLAGRVEAVHRERAEVPAGLAEALRVLLRELEAHMQKEELVLFPMIRQGTPMVVQPIAVLRAEHDEHGERLRHVEELAHQCVPPDDACNTWRALYAGVRKLIDDVMEHIHLENNVLFPAATGLRLAGRSPSP
ncbi:MAG: iron-sulfur cluster repair protein YtfE [Sinimarinibacterium sp.]|jgi:regulator of cell morphogenesis and NO signaling